jgi:general secretion pathway protein A
LLDEAHDICAEVLGILRILTNLDMDSRLVISVILSGQSPLGKLLSHPRLEDVVRRLAPYATLRLLSSAEIKPYVEHRCHIAGTSNCPFDSPAIDALNKIGPGNFCAIKIG